MFSLKFVYGTMNSGKSTNLILTAHKYESNNKKVCVMKSSIDSRSNCIDTRAGLSHKLDYIIKPEDDYNQLSFLNKTNPDIILIDESQFLSKQNIDVLKQYTKICPIICYGIKTDYMLNLFEGSKRLLEIADELEEIKTVCHVCFNSNASINCRYNLVNDNNDIKIVKSGNQIDIGSEDKYMAICWNCYVKYD